MDGESSAAGLGEGAGDGQAQAAAPVGTALVPPDEPLGEIHPVGQLLPRCVAEHRRGLPVCCGQLQVDPGALQGVLEGVADQVLEHPVQPVAVGGDPDRGLRQTGPQGKAALLDGLTHVRKGLAKQLCKINRLYIYAQVARSGLAHLEHVPHHDLEPLGLVGEDTNVVLHMVGQALLLLEQLGIADDGGEGGFEIVGDVCDQLHLHPLAHLFGQCGTQTLLHVGELLRCTVEI